MAGLRQAPPPPAQGGAMAGGSVPEGMIAATPEEQALYDRFVGRSMQMIYDPKFMKSVVGMLDTPDDPKEGLADTAAQVILRVLDASKKANVNVPGDVLMAAGTEVFEQLAEMATEAGIYDFAGDEDAKEGAFFRALDQVRTVATQRGLIDQAMFQQDFAAIQKANESGDLERGLMALAGEGAA